MVEDFEHPEKADYVRWQGDGRWIEKRYPARVTAVRLSSGTGVAITEIAGRPNNAVIYNEDGSLRVRSINGDPRHGETVFDSIYYVGDELTAIVRGPGIQTACVYDEDGNLLSKYENR
jgi:YD repeat-containing protein